MHRVSFVPSGRWRRLGRVIPVLVMGCGDPAPTAPPDPVAVYETEHFLILDAAALDSATIATVQGRLELEYDRVATALPDLGPPLRITARILEGAGIPFVTPGELSLSQWGETLALNYLPHQLAHLFTGYVRRPFLEEGLAVHLTELLLPDDTTVNPYRGQPPHAWVSLYEQFGSTISLFTAYGAGNFGHDYNGSSTDASAWQVFVEAGSFARWVIETRGWETWWTLYATDDLGGTLGAATSELETAWLAAVMDQYPDPRPCEVALGTVGPREEYWCARTRGE